MTAPLRSHAADADRCANMARQTIGKRACAVPKTAIEPSATQRGMIAWDIKIGKGADNDIGALSANFITVVEVDAPDAPHAVGPFMNTVMKCTCANSCPDGTGSVLASTGKRCDETP